MTTDVLWKQKLSASARVCRADRADIVSQFAESRKKLGKQLSKLGLKGNFAAERDAERKLRDSYYSRWLSSSYPVVDLSFTASKVELLLRRTPAGVDIIGAKDRQPEGPTEMEVSVGRYAIQRGDRSELFGSLPDPQCDLGSFVFSQFQLNRERFRTFTGRVKCSRPEGYPTSLRKRLRDIAAMSLEAHAAGMRAGVAVGAAQLTRAILWEPRIEDMYIAEQIVVRDDPAILVMSGERAHLIGFWDSPNENPIEGVLREFSEGSFENLK